VRALLLAALVIFALAAVRAQSMRTLPIALTVAETDGAPVVDEAWIAERMAQADAIFAPAGLAFRIRERAAMGAPHVAMEDRSDRHALAERLAPGSINVFVVGSLRDVDEPSRMRQGVHWRSPRVPGSHYVILSSVAGPSTLAHELGHFFGNPHSAVVNNIMSYERDGAVPPFFDAAQLRRIRARARHFLAAGELVP
jgi:hypothetical protein